MGVQQILNTHFRLLDIFGLLNVLVRLRLTDVAHC